jgi:hypothetical protein
MTLSQLKQLKNIKNNYYNTKFKEEQEEYIRSCNNILSFVDY